MIFYKMDVILIQNTILLHTVLVHRTQYRLIGPSIISQDIMLINRTIGCNITGRIVNLEEVTNGLIVFAGRKIISQDAI